ncbi:protein FAR1-RELATED SEQUENCE 5-like [Salvia miltiorrhiza]|uniref:protein FAR1-RELATED SEQUENCE 5-like n=1 Tax=Salvia miltiorrhiza TaxID=226208 RepID=UPI0025AB8CFC|nr:protein FAR1-RELATED SEQUENCE 5-like [Salvia miltiorrhiza]
MDTTVPILNNEGVLHGDHLYIPVCDESLKPFVGQVFKSEEDAFQFYKKYGKSSGFDVRRGSSKKGLYGQIIYRHLVCAREGINPGRHDENSEGQPKKKKRRRKPSTRNGYKARIIVILQNENQYCINSFSEAHNHKLISPECRHLMRCNRNLDAGHHMVMLKCAKANIGPFRAFRVFKELVGSYEDIGCTSNDFRNLSYQMSTYPDGSDEQLLLDMLISQRDLGEGFKCEYLLDEFHKVKSIFWSDAIAVQNYRVFGDSVSFDATYSTNKYNMIFTPFTGKDNHGGCVTFAAALLNREDVTIENVMPTTRHRFCMWHIMTKIALKLPISLRENAELTSSLYGVAWSEIDEPSEFEDNWHGVINEYGLEENSWFSDMFSKRSYWIPAFFRDLSMSGLFKTTSMSESENSFFRKYLNRSSNLAAFYIHYESAMQAQRHSYK